VVAVELSSDTKPGRCGVTRNASGKGLLVVTRSLFAVGERLDVSVHVGSMLGQAKARVVRVEENARDSTETWRYRLALELDDALPAVLIEEARLRSDFSRVV
jgi:cell division septum initiation protein DivIVA